MSDSIENQLPEIPPPQPPQTSNISNKSTPKNENSSIASITRETHPEAVFVDKKGGYGSFKIRDVPKPIPDDGEILIQVIAVGLNFEDILARQGLLAGLQKSFIPCYECSGIVEMIGSDVTHVKEGDRVLVFQNLGCCSRYLKVKSYQCFKIPDKMSFQEAAGFALNYITAYILLFQYGNIHSGETILVHNIGGGVGLAALQLSKLVKDITVIGTGSQHKEEVLNRHGLQHFVDYKQLDYVKEIYRITDKRGVDVILNPLGGKDILKSEQLLTPLGRHILYGESNKIKGEKNGKKHIDSGSIKYEKLLKENKMICGFNLLLLFDETNYLETVLKKLFSYYEEGLIKPRIDTIYHCNRIGDAQKYITERRNIGKVVLIWNNADIILRKTGDGSENKDFHD